MTTLHRFELGLSLLQIDGYSPHNVGFENVERSYVLSLRKGRFLLEGGSPDEKIEI